MLKQRRLLQTCIQGAGLVALIVLIAVSFLGIGDVYMQTLNKDKTIVLDSSLFEERMGSDFRVDSMIKRHTPSSITEASLLNSDAVLFMTENTKDLKRTTGLSILNLTDNQIEAVIENENLIGMAVSPDGTKLIYKAIDSNYKLETIWFDLAKKIQLRSLEDKYWGYYQIMLNDHRLLEMIGFRLMIRDLQSGQSTAITDSDKLGILYNKRDTTKPLSKNSGKLTRIELAPGQEQVYVQLFLDAPENDIIRSVDMKTGAVQDRIQGQINDFIALPNHKLLLSGRINGIEGIYFVSDKEAPKLIAQGTYSNLAANLSRNAISYVMRSNDGRTKLMAAKLKGDTFSDEITVYGDPGYVRMLQWSQDGEALICLTEGIEGTDVYRFSFSAGNRL